VLGTFGWQSNQTRVKVLPPGAVVGRSLSFISIAVSITVLAGCRPPPPAASNQIAQESVGSRHVLDTRLRRLWPDDPAGPAWFGEDGYRVVARTPGQFIAIRAPISTLSPDLAMSGTFHKAGGPPGGGYGLIVRRQPVGAGDGLDQQGQFVVAAVGDRGEIGVWRRDGGRWLDLVPWTPSPAVQGGDSPNELSARVSGGRLTFSVNGVQVAEVPVGLQAGGVGIYVGGDLNEVVVHDLVVDELPASSGVAVADPAASLSSKEREVAAASARLAALSAASRSAATTTSDATWRANAADSLASLQRVGQEIEFEYGGRKVSPAQVTRVRDLMGAIAEDVTDIAYVFSDGFDSPRSPVNNPTTLADAAARLDSAARKAELVRAELQSLRGSVDGIPLGHGR
jgi:hypothetical protein